MRLHQLRYTHADEHADLLVCRCERCAFGFDPDEPAMLASTDTGPRAWHLDCWWPRADQPVARTVARPARPLARAPIRPRRRRVPRGR